MKTEVVYDEKNDTYSVGTTLDLTAGGKADGKGTGTSTKSSNTKTSSTRNTPKGASANTTSLGSATGYLSAPLLMSPEEYQEWSLRQSMQKYWRQKNQEAFENEGKNKFDFTDMHFDLGPAEKIFGPGGVQIKTQGSAEVKMGAIFQ